LDRFGVNLKIDSDYFEEVQNILTTRRPIRYQMFGKKRVQRLIEHTTFKVTGEVLDISSGATANNIG